jgi:hypothetical protein
MGEMPADAEQPLEGDEEPVPIPDPNEEY